MVLADEWVEQEVAEAKEAMEDVQEATEEVQVVEQVVQQLEAKANEVVTFAVRAPGPEPKGVARRYALGTFKLLGTVELPSPVAHAAADEVGVALLSELSMAGARFGDMYGVFRRLRSFPGW